MNRPDIAAFVLAGNATWIATAAALMTLFMRIGWVSRDARDLRNGFLMLSSLFAVGAVAAWGATWFA